jgi:hypothetical protein
MNSESFIRRGFTVLIDGVAYVPEEPKPAIKAVRWYDRHERMWCIWSEDIEGNHVGESSWVYSKQEAINEVGRREQDIAETLKGAL